ncbi:MAG: WD40 repeat domain-containing protein [Gemmataceae bacterium]
MRAHAATNSGYYPDNWDSLLLSSSGAGNDVQPLNILPADLTRKVGADSLNAAAVSTSNRGGITTVRHVSGTLGYDMPKLLLCLLLIASPPVRAAGTEPEPVALKAHRDTITCVVFAPDGKNLASGSKNGTAILWDLATGKPRFTLPGHKDMVTALAFAPDGKTLASASHADDILLWSVTSGERTGVLEGHAKDIRGIEFSPDGKILASAGVDETVRLWDWSAGKEIACLKGHTAEVNVVVFSPDGKKLASGGFDKTIKQWDVASRKLDRTLQGHTGLAWRDRTSPKLAQAAYDERELPSGHLDTKRLAILADALEEAGCTNENVLAHLRGAGPHVRGCWPVDLLLERE